jgi:hypothetical protein
MTTRTTVSLPRKLLLHEFERYKNDPSSVTATKYRFLTQLGKVILDNLPAKIVFFFVILFVIVAPVVTPYVLRRVMLAVLTSSAAILEVKVHINQYVNRYCESRRVKAFHCRLSVRNCIHSLQVRGNYI